VNFKAAGIAHLVFSSCWWWVVLVLTWYYLWFIVVRFVSLLICWLDFADCCYVFVVRLFHSLGWFVDRCWFDWVLGAIWWFVMLGVRCSLPLRCTPRCPGTVDPLFVRLFAFVAVVDSFPMGITVALLPLRSAIVATCRCDYRYRYRVRWWWFSDFLPFVHCVWLFWLRLRCPLRYVHVHRLIAVLPDVTVAVWPPAVRVLPLITFLGCVYLWITADYLPLVVVFYPGALFWVVLRYRTFAFLIYPICCSLFVGCRPTVMRCRYVPRSSLLSPLRL